jgi:LacI family transcriptional regulator
LRTKGYLQALEDNKIQPKPGLILKVNDKLISEESLEEIEKEIELLFKNNKDVDGIFAVNELYAITAMKVASKFNKKVPEDVQVIGFTDGVLSKHSNPSLTTVSQHALDMGEKAAELLIDRLEEDHDDDLEHDNYQTLVIETELIERNSTK